jgi:hypothetical protein
MLIIDGKAEMRKEVLKVEGDLQTLMIEAS